jgi:hypothetical protein
LSVEAGDLARRGFATRGGELSRIAERYAEVCGALEALLTWDCIPATSEVDRGWAALYAACNEKPPASADRNPEGQDREAGLGAEHESAVAKPDAQEQSHD